MRQLNFLLPFPFNVGNEGKRGKAEFNNRLEEPQNSLFPEVSQCDLPVAEGMHVHWKRNEE